MTPVIALGLLLAACTNSDDPSQPSAQDSEAADPGVLPESEMVAVCLTDPPSSNPDGPLTTDLCTVDLEGERRAIRRDIDPGHAVALSPDRTTVAFIDGGTLALVDLDGSNAVSTEVQGSSPEWVDDETVAVIAPGGRSIANVEIRSRAVTGEAVLDPTGLPPEMSGAVIESFAVNEGGEHVAASLYVDTGPPGNDEGDLFALADINSSTGAVTLLLGPTAEPIGYPDWSPSGELAITLAREVHLIDLGSKATTSVSPSQWIATTPTWSSDGQHLAWLANGVGGPDGPSVLVYSDGQPSGSQPVHVVGSRGGPLIEFPAFPDW